MLPVSVRSAPLRRTLCLPHVFRAFAARLPRAGGHAPAAADDLPPRAGATPGHGTLTS